MSKTDSVSMFWEESFKVVMCHVFHQETQHIIPDCTSVMSVAFDDHCPDPSIHLLLQYRNMCPIISSRSFFSSFFKAVIIL